MKKKIITAAVCVLAAAAAAVVLGVMCGEQFPMERECELYFLNENESSLVAETRVVRYRDDQNLKTAVIEELISGPEANRNKAVFSKKAKLLAVEQTGPADITVDFNYRFMSGDSARDTLAAYSVIKTLCAIDGIERVKVTVEKNDIPDSEGRPIGFLTDADINLQSDINTSETREITLYFADAATNKLVPEVRTIKVTDQLPLAQYIINELINGPSDKRLTGVLSPETILIGVNIMDNICFVNFRSNFISRNEGAEDEEYLTVYAIVNSLTELDSVGRVQFLIDGKKTEFFGDMRFDNLFERNTAVILAEQ